MGAYPEAIFALDEDERAIRETAAEFTREELRPLRERPFRGGEIPAHRTAFWPEYFDACMARIRKAGFCGMGLPEACGGAPVSSRAFALAIAEMSRAAPDIALSFGVDLSLFASPVVHFGTDEQKRRWLPRIARGEMHGCYCQTESEAGSDVSRVRTRARRSPDGRWFLDGEKIFVTNGSVADAAVVLARTSGAPGDHRGLTMFLVDLAAARSSGAVEVPPDEQKRGLHQSPTSMLVFRECPAEALGEQGRGFAIAMATLGASRPTLIAGQALGMLWEARELAKEYARSRMVFGKPLAALSRVRHTLAVMDAKARMAEILTWKACLEKDAAPEGDSRPYALSGSVAKILSADYAFEVADAAMQLHGGSGYVTGVAVGDVWLDARVIAIYEGTREVQEIIVAQAILRRLPEYPHGARGARSAIRGGLRSVERARWMATDERLFALEKALTLALFAAKRSFGAPDEPSTPLSLWYDLARAYAVLEGAKIAAEADRYERADLRRRPALNGSADTAVCGAVRLAQQAVGNAVESVFDAMVSVKREVKR